MNAKKIIPVIIFLLAAASLFAQSFTASVSKSKVAAGEIFELSFTLNTSGSGFKAPPLDSDFILYSGPNHSTSVQIINGNMSQSVTFSYVLAAKKEGKFTIGPASVTVNGNKLQSNPVTIEVKGTYNHQGSPQARQRQQQQRQQAQEAPASQSIADNLFVRTVVSKRKAYLGEQITVTQKLYTRLDVRGLKDVKFPAYTGFWAQDLPQKQHYSTGKESIDGIGYSVVELKKSYLFAQRSGKLTLPPVEAECIVLERVGSNNPWNDPFWGFDSYREAVYKVKSEPVTIDVSALPEEGKPQEFTGAVGEYSYKSIISSQKVKANEAINLSMTITGQGNIKLIEAQKLSFPGEFETYTPRVDDNISIGAGGVSGTKTFEYLVIPREPGEYTIGGASFSYFDPQQEKYITIPSPEFSIKVEKGDNTAPQVTTGNAPRQSIRTIGNDIRYIKTGNIVLAGQSKPFFGSPLFITGLSAPVAAFILFLLLRRRHIERNSDAVQVKSRKATSMARKRLAFAEQHMKSGNKESFYEEIFRALYGYISDKLNIPVADLSRDRITAALAARNVKQDTIGKLAITLDACEFARYAPSAASADLAKTYSDSVELITTIEGQTKSM